LQQLATKNTQISGIITFNDLQTANAFSENCSWWPLQAVSNYGVIYKQTEDWVIKNQAEKENFVFYVVGSAELIVTVRKLLRTYGFAGSQIKSKGFWH
jgi:NADPH-dependent ferric siderophore reductase